ncbi:MAG: glycosyltransferase [Opitutaceae bacterium]|jgi:hypothetical protein
MGAITFTIDPQLVGELRRHLPFTTFVETGTFRGQTLDLVQPWFDECISVELSDELFAAAQRRFSAVPNIHLYHSDSAQFLRENKARYQGKSVLFWLDAHWCAGGESGEKSQCPLLEELAAIGTLNRQSVLLIDDARLFLAPPPLPHEISDWPDFDSILQRLRQLSDAHAVVCFNDVILFAPQSVQPHLRAFLHEHAADQLQINDKSRHYDEILAQAQAKDVEIAALKNSANEILAQAKAKDTEIAALKISADEILAQAKAKDTEIAAQKKASDERGRLVIGQKRRLEDLQAQVSQLQASLATRDDAIARLEQSAGERKVSIDSLKSKLALESTGREKNLEAEAIELRASAQNQANSHWPVEQAKYFGRQLAEKEAVIQSLHRANLAQEKLIRLLAANTTSWTAIPYKFWLAAQAFAQAKIIRPLGKRIFKRVVENYWMQIGVLEHYDPRPVAWDRFPRPRLPLARLPQMALVTPSFNQAAFVETTLLSVLDQNYPKLLYGVRDGGSRDASRSIIERHAAKLDHAEFAPDHGQADAICQGFARLAPKLGPDDGMAWLNSDDLLAPHALRYVAEFFAEHPKVDVVYGHRIIIDKTGYEIGRWVMPRHDPRSLEWIDYVPQETLFWRKRAWDLVGGLDPSYQFALDWDLLARFTLAKLQVVRLPYFLGCFRVHHEQKTCQHIHSTGADEMARVRTCFHGAERQGDMGAIDAWSRRIRFQGALTARLHALGIRW